MPKFPSCKNLGLPLMGR